MKRNLISVIIPAYNYAGYIGETLQSLIAQTHQNWECIVIDDGSTDNTQEIVAGFILLDERIKYIYQNNAGQSSARNNGLRNATGDYIQFLDADDLLEPVKLEHHIKFLENFPEVHIVYGETRYFRTGFPDERRYSISDPDEPWMPKISGQGEALIRKILTRNITTVSSPLIRRNVIDKVGEFDFNLDPLEDWDFWLRCALANYEFQFIEAEGTRDLIRIHSLSSSQNKERLFSKHKLTRKKMNSLLPSRELIIFNKHIWLDRTIYKGKEEIRGGNVRNGISTVLQAISFDLMTTTKFIFNAAGKKITKKFLRRNSVLERKDKST